MSTPQIEWDDARIARLAELWASGMKTQEIADELGISKNSVVGKVHRLGLPERGPSILPVWTEKQNARFCRAWTDGVPVADIAKEFRISEGWVATKARRLNLERRGPGGRRHLEGRTLPPIAAPTAVPAPVMRVRGPTAATAPVKSTATVPLRPPAPAKPVAPLAPIRTAPPAPQPCCWPIGEPGTPSFHFCGHVTTPGKPYCAEHCAVAFVPVPQRGDHLRRIDRDVRNGMARTGAERWV